MLRHALALAIAFALAPAALASATETVRNEVEPGHGTVVLTLGAMREADAAQSGAVVVERDASGAILHWRLAVNGLRWSVFCQGSDPASGRGYVNVGLASAPVRHYDSPCGLTAWWPARGTMSGHVEFELARVPIACEQQPFGCGPLPSAADPVTSALSLGIDGWAATAPAGAIAGFDPNSLDPATYASGTVFGCTDSKGEIALTGCGEATGTTAAAAFWGGDASAQHAAVALGGGEATCRASPDLVDAGFACAASPV